MQLDALIVSQAAQLLISHENARHWDRLLTPVPCVDDRLVLDAAILTECGPGQWWESYAPILSVLDREMVDMPENSP